MNQLSGCFKKILIDDLPFIVDPNGLDPLETRKKMREYVDKKYADDMTYDVILALSANEKFKDLDSSVDGRFGVSAVGGACADNELITIVVHDLGQFSGVKTAVHHFSHMLGSYHDGEESNKKCCSSQGDVMSMYVYDQESLD